MSQCGDDVANAQNYANGRVCTQEVAEMECPDDPGHTYQAKNGCEIWYLDSRGWSCVSQDNGSGGNGDDNDTARAIAGVGGMVFMAAAGYGIAEWVND